MTNTDDRPDFEDIAQENAVLDRLRRLREARDAAHKALQDAIAETHHAGMYFEVMNTAVNPCPSWCDQTCGTDPIDGCSPNRRSASRATPTASSSTPRSVRRFAAVLLLQLERITGSGDSEPSPATMRLYGANPARDDR